MSKEYRSKRIIEQKLGCIVWQLGKLQKTNEHGDTVTRIPSITFSCQFFSFSTFCLNVSCRRSVIFWWETCTDSLIVPKKKSYIRCILAKEIIKTVLNGISSPTSNSACFKFCFCCCQVNISQGDAIGMENTDTVDSDSL